MRTRFTRALALACVALGAIPALIHAQQGTTISGRVRSEAQQPLQGVAISVPSLRLGATTDEQGSYSFTVPAGRVAAGATVALTVRRIGYVPQTVNVALTGATVTRDFTLAPSATALEAVVVTALGIEKEKKALGVSQQTLSSATLNEGARTQNLVSALSGKIAGISVTSATQQGGSANIIIRGANSIAGNNQPLFVVDGVPIDNSSINGNQARQGYGGFDLGNAAGDLNPEDIASMSVLKGPNAAALYGARAANGVIIITTKSGGSSRGFSVGGNTTLSFERPLRLPQYQNTWGQGYEGDVCDAWHRGVTHSLKGNPAESYGAAPTGFNYATCGFDYVDGNYGGVNDGVDESWGPRLDGTVRNQFSLTQAGAVEARPWVAHPDNVKNYFNTGTTITTNGSAQGANDRASFRFSVTRQDLKGIVPRNSLAKTTSALNATARVSQKLSVDASAQYINNLGTNRPGTGYSEENPMMGFIWFGRQVDVAALKNHFIDADGNQISWNYSYHNNPYWNNNMNRNFDQRDRLMGVASATYRFTDWLRLTGRSGTDWYRTFYTYQYAAGWIGGGFDGSYAKGGFQEQNRFNQETNTDFLLTANRNVMENLGLTVNFGGNKRINGYRSSAFGTDELVIPGVYNISNSAKQVNPGEYTERKAINSLYGQAEFAYNDYAFVNVTGRNDWSSTLPEGKNSYFYPSVSGSLVLTELMPALGFNGKMNYAKLRGGWSRVGNDASPYQLQATYSALTRFGTINRLATPTNLLNPKLKPENTDAWEVGAETQFLDDRAGFDLTYYNKLTSNQILNLSVSPASGYSSAMVNAGEISNKGIEAQFTFSPLRNPDGLGWDVTMNYARNRSNVEKLYGDVQTVQLAGLQNWGLTVEARKGYPYGAMFGTTYLRCGNWDPARAKNATETAYFTAMKAATTACPTDGSANGMLLLNSRGRPRAAPSTAKTVIGNVMPDWTGGIDNTFHFKGVDFGFLIDTRQGGQIFSSGIMWGTYAGILKETEFRPDTGLLIAGWYPGCASCGPGGTAVAAGPNTTVHTRTEDLNHSIYYNVLEKWLVDASFWKLREARVAFNVPKQYLTPTHLDNARISIVGRNLAIWTKNKHIDPETSYSTSNFQGVEYGQMPTARSVGFQLTITP